MKNNAITPASSHQIPSQSDALSKTLLELLLAAVSLQKKACKQCSDEVSLEQIVTKLREAKNRGAQDIKQIKSQHKQDQDKFEGEQNDRKKYYEKLKRKLEQFKEQHKNTSKEKLRAVLDEHKRLIDDTRHYNGIEMELLMSEHDKQLKHLNEMH